jgi:drug/metabolite transporter (DMT)-like permease
MVALLLLLTVTTLYAGYNLLIKISGGYVPAEATTTILATICLQLVALTTSMVFMGLLLLRGGQVLHLSTSTYLWAAAAGLCIGGAEIAYFYLFGGIGMAKPVAANIAIPIIVSGTIVITMLVSYLVLKEPLTWNQLLGSGCIVLGIIILFLKKGASAT